jgi:hypothetical protein
VFGCTVTESGSVIENLCLLSRDVCCDLAKFLASDGDSKSAEAFSVAAQQFLNSVARAMDGKRLTEN